MKKYKYLELITILYVTFQLVSDVTAGKVISIFSYPVSITVLYFPITYIFSDVLTEVYGYAQARRVVWRVVLASVIAGVLYQVAAFWPPSNGFNANGAYVRVFSSVPRILVGGWVAVWSGGLVNDYVMAKMKIWTKGTHLWSRLIGSTVAGEFVNTFLFYTIALSGVLPSNILIEAIFTAWILKSLIEIVFTPWTYYVVAKLKKTENEDYYDTNTNFNPFILK
jgi:uncharacterized integral membrane protein (TIGR00697 family)